MILKGTFKIIQYYGIKFFKMENTEMGLSETFPYLTWVIKTKAALASGLAGQSPVAGLIPGHMPGLPVWICARASMGGNQLLFLSSPSSL